MCVRVCVCVSALLNPFSYYYNNDDYNDDDNNINSNILSKCFMVLHIEEKNIL